MASYIATSFHVGSNSVALWGSKRNGSSPFEWLAHAVEWRSVQFSGWSTVESMVPRQLWENGTSEDSVTKYSTLELEEFLEFVRGYEALQEKAYKDGTKPASTGC